MSIDERRDSRYGSRRASIAIDKFKEGRDLLDIFNQINNEESLSERPNVSCASRTCSVPLSSSGKANKIQEPIPKSPMIKRDSNLCLRTGISRKSERSTSILGIK